MIWSYLLAGIVGWIVIQFLFYLVALGRYATVSLRCRCGWEVSWPKYLVPGFYGDARAWLHFKIRHRGEG